MYHYSYKEAVSMLDSLVFFERPGFNSYITRKGVQKGVSLERQKLLLRYLEHPEKAFKVILVAGTSGKGSVSTMLASIVSASGKKTGLHVSPHLCVPEERVWMDGGIITEKRFAEMFSLVWEAGMKVYEKHNLGMPTYYELLLGMALCYFRANKAEYVVLEAGLGGKLDGVNAVERPVLSIITPIDKDHVEILGTTLHAIASDKACIIRPNTPLVISKQRPTVQEIVSNIARSMRSKPVLVEEPEHIVMEGTNQTIFSWKGTSYTLPVRGKHFALDAAIALNAAYTLGVSLENAEKALREVVLPGRSEIIPGKPVFVLDAAHNPHKIKAMAKGFAQLHHGKLGIIFTALADKNVKQMIRHLAILEPEKIWITRSLDGPRPVFDMKEMAKEARKITTDVTLVYSPKEAIEMARKSGCDRILCTGSMYFVGEVLKILK